MYKKCQILREANSKSFEGQANISIGCIFSTYILYKTHIFSLLSMETYVNIQSTYNVLNVFHLPHIYTPVVRIVVFNVPG